MSSHGSVFSRVSSVFDIADNSDKYPRSLTSPASSLDDDAQYDLKPPPPAVNPDSLEGLAGRLFSKDHLDLILGDSSLSVRFTRFVCQYRPNLAATLKSYIAASGRPSGVDQETSANALIDDALPAYLTHRLTHLVTDTLVKEITGNSAPLMKEMIPTLAEVYCLTDASLPDNPIVYASEEFYNTSQYNRHYVIGRNCRFLQGPKTSRSSIKRLVQALATGQEVTETVLNYRRDGTPFMNLLLIAPLYDNKGVVRYFLGCQIDVSALIENGRGLESFAQLLAQDRSPRVPAGLGLMWNGEENEVDAGQSRSDTPSSFDISPHDTVQRSGKRKILGVDDAETERALWADTTLGPSGRLPGVYQNYVLVRPYPSMNITFTSPALRIPGLAQTNFLDHIGGAPYMRQGISDSFKEGTAVTAKVSWLTNGDAGNGVTAVDRTRWIHCTPLRGSDDRVGVWMVVMVENEEITGQITRAPAPEVVDSTGRPKHVGAESPKFTNDKLFAQYMRRQGVAPGGNKSPSLPTRSGLRR